MSKHTLFPIVASFLVITSLGGLLVIGLLEKSQQAVIANSNEDEIVRVSLNYRPEDSESDLISSNIEEQVEVLGEDQVKETERNAEIVTANGIQKETSSTSESKPQPAPPPLSDGSCPVNTQSCVPCNINDGHWACRVESREEDGYLGWSCQNNNPGNIRYSTARISYIKAHGGPAPCGERFDSRGGTYMIFSSYNDGRNALKAYMEAIVAATHTAYGECADGDCSLSYVFSKYAPGDPNYASNIATKLGVSTDTSLQWVIAHKFEDLINAIQQKEGFFIQ
ncbi:hypothetical protein GF389_05250 [Candidatus Dojkabacteria bacterium]|nr:hypothetical protein [Candidatus Dojkabacteria bacterium]